MSILQLQISDRTLSASDLKAIYSGAQNIDSIKVTFDDEWTGFTKKAVFSRNGLDCYFSSLDSNGGSLIPAVMLEESGTIYIGIIGEKGTQRITSSLVRYRVGKGASVSDLLDPAATKSLMDLINQALANTGGTTGQPAGATFIPEVSSDGVLSWTNNGGLENPTSVNIKGPQGQAGVSPVLTAAKSEKTTTITITDASGTRQLAQILDGLSDNISSITQYYTRSTSGNTLPTTGWSTTMPTLSTSSPYMWTYFKVNFDEGTSVDSPAVLIGNYNDRLSAMSIYFLRSSSGSTPSTTASGWSTTLQEPTSANPYVWCHFRFTYFPYRSSSSHIVYSSVFLLRTYQQSQAASGLVLDCSSSVNTQDTTIGDAALTAIQQGIMPVIYANNQYSQVLRAEPYDSCGVKYLRLYYSVSSCSSSLLLESVDWKTSL